MNSQVALLLSKILCMSYVRFNPNPKSKNTGDCVVRAICAATDSDWDSVYMNLCLRGFITKDMPSSNSVWDAQLIHEGFSRKIMPFRDNYTVQDFCEEHPYGTYILGTGTHAVAVIDGSYYDAWDSGYETPTYYYRKEKN